MTDQEFKQARNRVSGFLKDWIHVLGLKWWEIDIDYKMGDAPQHSSGSGMAPMIVEPRWEYRYARVTVYIEEIPEDDEKLEKACVHELCHLFVNSMRGCDRCYDPEKEEYAVESITRALLWVRNEEK